MLSIGVLLGCFGFFVCFLIWLVPSGKSQSLVLLNPRHSHLHVPLAWDHSIHSPAEQVYCRGRKSVIISGSVHYRQESINKGCECPLLVALQKHLPINPLTWPALPGRRGVLSDTACFGQAGGGGGKGGEGGKRGGVMLCFGSCGTLGWTLHWFGHGAVQTMLSGAGSKLVFPRKE